MPCSKPSPHPTLTPLTRIHRLIQIQTRVQLRIARPQSTRVAATVAVQLNDVRRQARRPAGPDVDAGVTTPVRGPAPGRVRLQGAGVQVRAASANAIRALLLHAAHPRPRVAVLLPGRGQGRGRDRPLRRPAAGAGAALVGAHRPHRAVHVETRTARLAEAHPGAGVMRRRRFLLRATRGTQGIRGTKAATGIVIAIWTLDPTARRADAIRRRHRRATVGVGLVGTTATGGRLLPI